MNKKQINACLKEKDFGDSESKEDFSSDDTVAESMSEEDSIDSTNGIHLQPVHQFFISAQNKEINWSVFSGRLKDFPFTGKESLQISITADATSIDIYCLSICDKFTNLVVTETSRYAGSCQNITRRSRMSNWMPLTANSFEKFIGLSMWIGLNKRPQITD